MLSHRIVKHIDAAFYGKFMKKLNQREIFKSFITATNQNVISYIYRHAYSNLIQFDDQKSE